MYTTQDAWDNADRTRRAAGTTEDAKLSAARTATKESIEAMGLGSRRDESPRTRTERPGSSISGERSTTALDQIAASQRNQSRQRLARSDRSAEEQDKAGRPCVLPASDET